MARIIDLTGQRFGKLSVIKEVGREKSGSVSWQCKCDCGKLTTTSSTYLRKGHTKSCGCLHEGKLADGNKKHGMHGTKIYYSWYGMKRRCVDKNNKAYYRYGGRGIEVCEKWHTFEGFYEDMSATHKDGLQLDRIDVNKGYYKENCRWSNSIEQANNKENNRVLTYEDKPYTMSELSKKFNINYGTLKSRLNKGLSVQDAVSEPIQNKRRR